MTLKISFTKAASSRTITRTGVDQVASIDPYGKTTPTLGRKRSFFEDLFGNIGTVGARARAGAAADDAQPNPCSNLTARSRRVQSSRLNRSMTARRSRRVPIDDHFYW